MVLWLAHNTFYAALSDNRFRFLEAIRHKKALWSAGRPFPFCVVREVFRGEWATGTRFILDSPGRFFVSGIFAEDVFS